jgi:hypothetical protein
VALCHGALVIGQGQGHSRSAFRAALSQARAAVEPRREVLPLADALDIRPTVFAAGPHCEDAIAKEVYAAPGTIRLVAFVLVGLLSLVLPGLRGVTRLC